MMERYVDMKRFVSGNLRIIFAVRGPDGGVSVDIWLEGQGILTGTLQVHRKHTKKGTCNCWTTGDSFCDFDALHSAYGLAAVKFEKVFADGGSNAVYNLLESYYEDFYD